MSSPLSTYDVLSVRQLSVHLSLVTVVTLLSATAAYAQAPLEEVVVTALGVRSTIDDAIQPVEVLSGSQLRQQRSTSIGETLAKQPGITATYFGPTASRPVIRGLSGERVQMLEDSISALDVSSLSEDHAVSIEDSLATQIEIVKGPAALLYGSGAVGGVVNILTNRIPEHAPQQGIGGMAEVRGDQALSERAGVAALEFGNELVAVHLDGYKRKTKEVRIPGDTLTSAATEAALDADPDAFIAKGRIYNSASDAQGGAAGVSLLSERGFLGASVSNFKTVYGVPLSPGENPEDGGPNIDMKQTRVDVKGQLDGEGWMKSLRLRAAHNDYEHAELEPDGEVGTLFQQQGTELRVALDHETGLMKGSAGVQYKELDFSAIGEERFVVPSVTRNTGVFVFEQLPLKALTLEAGLRIEQQSIQPEAATGLPDYSKSASSASLGGLWKLGEQSLALNFTRSQRHPTATELYADGPHEATAQFIIGDTQLQRETANTVDLVWRGGDAVHWHVSAFMNQFSNYIYLAPTADVEDDLPVFEYRQSKAQYVGAEAAIDWRVFERDAKQLNVTLTADTVRAEFEDGDAVPQIPPLRYGVAFDYRHGGWLTNVSAFHYNKQGRVAEYETPTDGYTLVDADVRYQWQLPSNTVEMFLRGTNLTDTEARRHVSPLKEFAPLAGRSLHLGVGVEF
jgi:iron complex outermembrane receptor protein